MKQCDLKKRFKRERSVLERVSECTQIKLSAHLLVLEIWQLVARLSLPLDDNLLEDVVRPLEVVVDDDDVERAALGVVELADCCCESRGHGLFGLGAAAGQAGLERGERGGRDENVERVQIGVVLFDELDALWTGRTWSVR